MPFDVMKQVITPITGAADKSWELGKDLYKHIDKLAWLLVPGAGVLATLGAVRALTPKAVADTSDKYVINEALKSSLAESIRRHEMIQQEKEAEAAYNEIRKHDRFV